MMPNHIATLQDFIEQVGSDKRPKSKAKGGLKKCERNPLNTISLYDLEKEQNKAKETKGQPVGSTKKQVVYSNCATIILTPKNEPLSELEELGESDI
jgi:hypothetical protein